MRELAQYKKIEETKATCNNAAPGAPRLKRNLLRAVILEKLLKKQSRD